MIPDRTVPYDAVMPDTAQTVLILVSGLAALVSVLYAVRGSLRRRDLVLIFLVIGAGMSVYYEALADTLIKAYYPEQGQVTWIHSFGRDIPVFIGFLYFWYLPAMAYWLLARAKYGVSARAWWTHWILFWVGANVFEMAALTIGGNTWIYHGTQAFKILGVPILTPMSYVSLDIAIAAGVCALVRFLPRSQHWVIVPAVPLLFVASQAGTFFPNALALHGSDETWVVMLGSFGCLGLAVGLSHILSLAFRNPWPAEVTDGVKARPKPARLPTPRAQPAPSWEYEFADDLPEK